MQIISHEATITNIPNAIGILKNDCPPSRAMREKGMTTRAKPIVAEIQRRSLCGLNHLAILLNVFGVNISIRHSQQEGSSRYAIRWTHWLESGLIPTNIRHLPNGWEKLICSLKIQPYGFFATIYVYELYFYAFAKDPAFLLNSTDVKSRDTIFQTIYLRQKHQIERKSWLNDQRIRGNSHQQAVMRSPQLGEKIAIGMTGCPAFVEQTVFWLGW
jgi:hypothetical protein